MANGLRLIKFRVKIFELFNYLWLFKLLLLFIFKLLLLWLILILVWSSWSFLFGLNERRFDLSLCFSLTGCIWRNWPCPVEPIITTGLLASFPSSLKLSLWAPVNLWTNFTALFRFSDSLNFWNELLRLNAFAASGSLKFSSEKSVCFYFQNKKQNSRTFTTNRVFLLFQMCSKFLYI